MCRHPLQVLGEISLSLEDQPAPARTVDPPLHFWIGVDRPQTLGFLLWRGSRVARRDHGNTAKMTTTMPQASKPPTTEAAMKIAPRTSCFIAPTPRRPTENAVCPPRHRHSCMTHRCL